MKIRNANKKSFNVIVFQGQTDQLTSLVDSYPKLKILSALKSFVTQILGQYPKVEQREVCIHSLKPHDSPSSVIPLISQY